MSDQLPGWMHNTGAIFSTPDPNKVYPSLNVIVLRN